jgi:hypothetical protein
MSNLKLLNNSTITITLIGVIYLYNNGYGQDEYSQELLGAAKSGKLDMVQFIVENKKFTIRADGTIHWVIQRLVDGILFCFVLFRILIFDIITHSQPHGHPEIH